MRGSRQSRCALRKAGVLTRRKSASRPPEAIQQQAFLVVTFEGGGGQGCRRTLYHEQDSPTI